MEADMPMQQEVELNASSDILPAEAQRRKIHLQKSLPGKLVRRWNSCTRYFGALAQRDLLRRFTPVLDRHFEHEWLAGTSVQLRFLPGQEDRELHIPWLGGKWLLRFRYLPWREECCYANWNAPITVSVYKKGKDGGKPCTVRYMSMFIKDRIFHIPQLQGIPLIEMPKGLRDWAERFVRATMDLARQENFRGVRVARAEAVYSYHYPSLPGSLPPNAREREEKRIRSNIEIHHNGTATALGFRPMEEWFEWENPDYQAR